MNDGHSLALGGPEWHFFFPSAAAARRVWRRMRSARALGCAYLRDARLRDEATIALVVPRGRAWTEALDVPVLAALAGADVDDMWCASRCPDAHLLARLCQLLRVRGVPTNPDEAELALLDGTGRVRVARGDRDRHAPPGHDRRSHSTQIRIPIPRRPSPVAIPRLFVRWEDA